jgi:hypothetical protein
MATNEEKSRSCRKSIYLKETLKAEAMVDQNKTAMIA